MMRILSMLCCGVWLLAAGCKGGQESSTDQAAGAAAAPVDPQEQYKAELSDLCFGEERSGAMDQPEAQRAMFMAQWLGTRIHTQQGRDFLAQVARAAPAEKAALLQAEATRLGLPSCPLVQSWGGTAP
jgi:hypothetical protein